MSIVACNAHGFLGKKITRQHFTKNETKLTTLCFVNRKTADHYEYDYNDYFNRHAFN